MAARIQALLSLLIASALLAQPAYFGERAPLTATRYTALGGYPVLADNGRDLFLFWSAGSLMRVTRVNRESRVGRPVMDMWSGRQFGVVWTGSHFLAMATKDNAIHARLLDSNGDPLGAAYVVTPGADPDLAFNGTHVAVLYTDFPAGTNSRVTRVLLVNRNGTRTGTEPAVIDNHHYSTPPVVSAIAARGDGFGVLSNAADGVRFTRLTASGAIASQTIVAARTNSSAGAVIAGNDDGYLAAWNESSKRIVGKLLDRDGAVGRGFAIDAEEKDVSIGGTRVSWSNGAWELAYSAGVNPERSEIRTIRLDADGAVIGRGMPLATGSVYAMTSATFRGHTYFAWLQAQTGRGPITMLGQLGVQDATTDSEPVQVAFGATEQEGFVTATSADSLLVFWTESKAGGITWHHGIRSRSGTWTERETDAVAYYAASDGTGFGVVQYHGPGIWSVGILDAQGQLVARTPQISNSFYAWAIASNGDGYVVVGPRITSPWDILAVRVSTSGAVSEPVILQPARPYDFDSLVSVTSDGTSYLAVMKREVWTCVNCFESTKTVLGFRFDHSLRRVDAESFTIADFSIDPLVVRNGSGWSVVTTTQSRSQASVRTIPAAGPMGAPAYFPVRNAKGLVPFGTNALAAITSNGTVSIVRGGTVVDLEELGGSRVVPHLTRLPDGRVAYLTSNIERSAPFHGSPRNSIAIIDSAPLPQPPDPPRLTARIANGWAVVDWTPPPQRVTSYRVEYRVGDGSWNELEASLDTDSRSIIALQPKVGVTYAFRVRAVNEGGTGPYSEPVTVGAARQRVVRR